MAKQSHPYKSKENIHSSKLEEPSAAYVSADLRGTYLDIVSEDMFRSAISKAVSDFDKGLVISHNQIDELVWSSFATEGLFSILEYVETDFGSRVS